MPRRAAGLSIEPQLIESGSDLALACESWRRLPAIGIDTEFVRERTFFPGLGLIQVSDGEGSFLIDTVAITNLDPLLAVLLDPAITKVFHSCGEDLEVLYHRFNEFPRAVFDTQIAATLVGFGSSPGYSRLVSVMFDVDLPKDKQRTNWLKRPLSKAQEDYAALDVAYLMPAWKQLRARLRQLDREDWLQEELEPLFDPTRFLPDPGRAYLRLGAHRGMPPRQLASLRALCDWRERQARRRDLPRSFVLKDKALVEIARRAPTSRRALTEIGSLHPKTVERYGTELLGFVRAAGQLPADALPEAVPPPIDLRPYRDQLRRLRATVASIAEKLELPAELLATRRTIESLLRRAVAKKSPTLPRELHGWRREIIGEALLVTLDAG